MKRILSASPMIVCILYAIFPVCRIVSAICGYDFVLRNYPVSVVFLAVASIIVSVLLLSLKISLNKVQMLFSALLPPISAINGLFFALDGGWEATAFFTLICYGCSIVILAKFAHPFALKIISAVLSVSLVLLLLFSTWIISIFGDLGLKTVVKSVTSPQNTYTAEVIDDNQGALGGNTLVNVWNNGKMIDLFICKFSQLPIRVYTGNWGEFNNMKISWKNEHTLIINSREYYINA